MIRLTKGEKLYLIRRRKGQNQDAFGARWGLTHDRLTAIERGKEPVPPHMLPISIKPTEGELVTTMRRRLGWTVRKFAAYAERSHVTIHKVERGDIDAEPYILILARLLQGGKRAT